RALTPSQLDFVIITAIYWSSPHHVPAAVCSAQVMLGDDLAGQFLFLRPVDRAPRDGMRLGCGLKLPHQDARIAGSLQGLFEPYGSRRLLARLLRRQFLQQFPRRSLEPARPSGPLG